MSINTFERCPICGVSPNYLIDAADGYFGELHAIQCSNPECPVEDMRMFECSFEKLEQSWNNCFCNIEIRNLKTEIEQLKGENQKLKEKNEIIF